MNKQIIIIIAILVFAFSLHAADVVVYPRTTGTPYPCPVQKTGATNSFAAEDDGALQKGIAWPNPRFTVQANTNCVIDNLTGLMWARNANQFSAANWGVAITNCNNLNYGGYTDWRLPNYRELLSLFNSRGEYRNSIANTTGTGAWTEGDAFNGIQEDSYWSSTTLVEYPSYGWLVGAVDRTTSLFLKTNIYYTWPVRGGY